ncbi:MAG: hypothetical protein KDD45_10205, partial [Bdellovibrionales bacterium]|nr:hypothetical protein [Bdellovibrionales bacterium]
LKKHQQLNSISFELNGLDMRVIARQELRIKFKTKGNKIFESTYKPYNSTYTIWKVDFSRSQIFPELLKDYANIIQYNSYYYLRIYDSKKESEMISLKFDNQDCKSLNSVKALARVDNRP